jgi:hypothetical protein
LASDQVNFNHFIIIIFLLDNPSIIFLSPSLGILFAGIVFIILSICSLENLGNSTTLNNPSIIFLSSSLGILESHSIILSICSSENLGNFINPSIIFLSSSLGILGLHSIILSICSSKNLGNFITFVPTSNNSFALTFTQLIVLLVIIHHLAGFISFALTFTQLELLFTGKVISDALIPKLFSQKLFKVFSNHFTFLN